MQNDILFDNIYVGHSVEEAKALQKETFDVKIVAEKAEEKAAEPKFDEEKDADQKVLNFKDDPVKFVRGRVEQFLAEFKKDPIEAVKANPQTAAPLGVAVLAVVALVLTLLSPAPSAPADAKSPKGKDAADKSKDKSSASVATGADSGKDGVQKRTTRSSDKS
jgi:calnexin